ncbi:MAG: hypothetical protein AAF639_37620 [Chloroflexota bacterium]
MNFTVAPDPIQKLTLLGNTTEFEPAGTQPTEESPSLPEIGRQPTGERRPKPLPCISDAVTPAGKKPLLKAMMTTACKRNYYYCPFRAGRSRTERITFSPDEMASTFNTLNQSGHVDGLFLSSGIIKGSVTTLPT